MKKWITKAEITKILNTYSVKNGEFVPVEKIENFYKNRMGYTITIKEEENFGNKTGRIVVSHTRANGKKTFNDIWERDENNHLQFRFRNLWNQPFSDAECIKDLEEQIQQLKQVGRKLQKQLQEEKSTSNLSDLEYQKLKEENKILCNLLENANQEKKKLLEQIHILEAKFQKLNSDTVHNARGAGRKCRGESPKTIEKLEQVKDLLYRGFGEQEIIEKLGISRATFYRYKKSINS